MPTKYEPQSAEELLGVLEELDIIEFNRGAYSHFAFHISGGICVHVDAPGVKCAQLLEVIAGGARVKVNNSEVTAAILEVSPRSREEAIERAYAGLPRNEAGDVILGRKISVNYTVTSYDNCEGYANYWKYDHPSGWSNQAHQIAPLGWAVWAGNTSGRVAEYVSAASIDVLDDDDAPVVLKGVALVTLGGAEVARRTAQAGSAVYDVFTAGIQRVFS